MALKRLKSQMNRYNLFSREVFRKTKSQEKYLVKELFQYVGGKSKWKGQKHSFVKYFKKAPLEKNKYLKRKNTYGILDL